MNRHSKLYGNDPSAVATKRQRGQRVFCSNRGQRGGCGRTFFMALADVLPRHTVTASFLWQWLSAMLSGGSVKAAVEKLRLPFALETLYRVQRELRHGLDQVRARLCQKQSPSASAHTDPLLQTVEHLRQVFSGSGCPPAEFQLHFQHPFLD